MFGLFELNCSPVVHIVHFIITGKFDPKILQHRICDVVQNPSYLYIYELSVHNVVLVLVMSPYLLWCD